LLIFGPVRDKHKKYGRAREAEEMCDDLDRSWGPILLPRNQSKSLKALHSYVIRTFPISFPGVFEPKVLCISQLSHAWDIFGPLHSPLLLKHKEKGQLEGWCLW